MKLEWSEFTPLVASFALSIALSVIAYRKNENTKNEPENNFPRFPLCTVIASLITAYTSGVALLGKPAESYQYGIQFQALLTIGVPLSSLSVLFFMPIALKLKGASLYEYFRLRFDWKIEKIVVVQFTVAKLFMTALNSLPPAFILSYFTEVSLNATLILIISITTGYTMIGGLKGVVWTDTLQAIIMFAALIVMTITSVIKVGGLNRVFQIAYDTDRLSLKMPTLDPSERISFWAFLTGANVAMVMNQSWYQRIKTLKSDREIKQSLLFQFLGMYIIGLGSCFMGLAIYAYYYGCDPKEAKLIDSYSNIVIHWLEDVGRKIPGLRGLYISGITCAAISSVSTNLNSIAVIAVDSFMQCSSRRRIIRWTQIWTLVAGAASIALALYIKNAGSLVELNQVFISLDGITTGLFILGALFLPATIKGALAGGVTSLIVTVALIIGSRKYVTPYPSKLMSTDFCMSNFNHTISHHDIKRDIPDNGAFFLFKISPFVSPVVAFVTTVVVGSAVSWLCPDEKEPKTNPDLYHPIIHRFLPKEILFSKVIDTEAGSLQQAKTNLLGSNVVE